jgi:TPR repeat protein
LLKRAADAGSVPAQICLAELFSVSECVEADASESAKYARFAALSGDAASQFRYGASLRRGDGVGRNEADGLAFLRLSGERGHVDAMGEYAASLLWDPSREKWKEAVPWLDEAANQGNTKAQSAFALALYKEKEGIEPDWDRALPYARQSAKAGDAIGQCCYGYVLLYGSDRNRAKALKYLRRSADQGFALAQAELSFWLDCEFSGCCDFEQSAKYARLSAEQGDREGQWLYGIKLLDGKGVDQNLAEGMKYLLLSAAQGESIALSSLTDRCLTMPESISAEAVNCLRLEAENGDCDAQRGYGCCLLLGLGVPAAFPEAINSYIDNVENDLNITEAQVIVAAYYCCGRLENLGVENRTKWVNVGLDQFNKGSPPRWIQEMEKSMLGGSADSDVAFALRELQASADAGNRTAQLLCGLSLRSRPEGVRYLRLSAAQGLQQAKVALWSLYRDFPPATQLSLFQMADSCLSECWLEQDMKTRAIKIFATSLTDASVVRPFLIGGMCEGRGQNPRALLQKFGRGLSSANAQWAGLIAKSRQVFTDLGVKLWLAGWCYENGCGVDLNLSVAADFYRRSAEAGFALARYHYALFLCHGVGVRQDRRAAVRELRLAADAGNANAMFEYGLCLEYGVTLERNLARAVRYYEKAAARNYPSALKAYGACLMAGRGVRARPTKGLKQLARAEQFAKSQEPSNADLLRWIGK